MKRLLIVALLTATPVMAAPTGKECLQWALWKEARGESLKTQRAVLDVIFERARVSGKGLCAVLKKPQQFPYFRRGVKRVDFAFTTRYNVVLRMKPVLPEGYKYFNHVRHKWGRDTVKIGGLYFSK